MILLSAVASSVKKKPSSLKRKKRKKLGLLSSFLIPGLSLLFLGGFFWLGTKIVFQTSGSFPQKTLGFREMLPTPIPYPVSKNMLNSPDVSARSAIVVDIGSGVVLYQKEPDLRLFPASTTKMMTALVALENFNQEEVLTVGKFEIAGNSIRLVPGERITVENLLSGLLVGSGNDAALVLAENFPGGKEKFVLAMNAKALELGLQNTHFTNPSGLDEKNHYSTASDLAKLARVIVKNPILAKIVSQPEVTVTDISGGIFHRLKNTNELVGKVEGVKGVKTGLTQSAGECLITLVERNGEKIVIAMLGSNDRFGETQKLIDWIFANFSWQLIVPTSYH